MIASLRERYQGEVDLVIQIMSDELAHWPWAALTEVEKIIRDQLARKGKLLRPLLALAVADLLGGQLEPLCAPAASVEFYHLASLVLDDVQDNSAVRRGAPAVHTTASTSMAINIAMTIRSLSYHPIHRSALLGPSEKLSLHRELDHAATELVLGQSIDIGWHLSWYQSHADFPYRQMIRWKTGSMFGCAAAMGARVTRAPRPVVDAARHLGGSLGALYQTIDDYLDVFGADESDRPKLEDFRGRKMTSPVILLLHTLSSASRADEVKRITEVFSGNTEIENWDWLIALMQDQGIAGSLRSQISEQAAAIDAQMSQLAPAGDPVALRAILGLMTAPLHTGDEAAGSGATQHAR